MFVRIKSEMGFSKFFIQEQKQSKKKIFNLTSDINKGNCYMTTTFDKHKVIVSFK
jgi:hypothetical protein